MVKMLAIQMPTCSRKRGSSAIPVKKVTVQVPSSMHFRALGLRPVPCFARIHGIIRYIFTHFPRTILSTL